MIRAQPATVSAPARRRRGGRLAVREERRTLTRYTIESEHRHPGSTGDFSGLLNAVATAVKIISNQVNRGALVGALGSAGGQNVQGEVQKRLDLISNEVMIGETEWAGHLAAMASEEMQDIYPIPECQRRGKYLLVFDPLDGSSNIDANVSVGTIFSILRSPEPGAEPRVEHFLQPGTAQVCAGFALYGPSTMLILTTGDGVDGFTLDRDIGAFILTHPQLRIPQDCGEFAINASNERFWEPPVRRYIQECLAGQTGPRGRDFNMRWIASLVAETYRILTRGGVFLYPKDSKEPDQGGAAPADARVQPDRVHRRAGRRRREHRTRAGHGPPADGPAPACPADPRDPGTRSSGSSAITASRLAGRSHPSTTRSSTPVPCSGSSNGQEKHMSAKHPIIAVTGSSGAGTSSVTRTFQHIFVREQINATIVEGDSFHRYDRQQMSVAMAEADQQGDHHLCHFSPEANLLTELEDLFREYGERGGGQVRKYLHDAEQARPLRQQPGEFTPWQDIDPDSDMLFYEGLHGAAVTEKVDIAQHADLLIGVVPIINLEWIQKLHRDKTARGYSSEAIVDTILRRMPDYVHYICPQFSRTHVNFQRVPTVDTSNPFIARFIPTADESFLVIRFANPRGIDFPYLLSMLHDSFMSRPNIIVVPGGKMELAMQLIFTPLILRFMEARRQA